MQEIGGILRRAREGRGASLREAQAATKISLKYLEALECGDEAAFPGEVYLKGFLRTYAEFLGLDGWEMVRRYRESRARREREQGDGVALAGGRSRPHPEASGPGREGGRGRRAKGRRAPAVVRPDRSLVYAAVLLLILAAAGILLSHYLVTLAPQEVAPPAQPAAPGASGASGAPGAAGAPDGPAAGNAAGPGGYLVGGAGQGSGPPARVTAVGESPFVAEFRVTPAPIVLLARCVDRCWVSVSADEAPAAEETLARGDERTWRAQSVLRLRAGNPGALFISVNGQYLGAAGDDGVPRDLVFRTVPQ